MTKFYQLLLIFVVFASLSGFSQAPSKVTLKGTIVDTTTGPMGSATVMLLQPKDSTLINFARANDKGEFVFKNVKNQKYIFKVSYTAYLPLSEVIGPYDEAEKDLGNVKIKPISKELMEVVVRTARAPLTIKGDTIEYDARSFKVPEGSTVEDLLRRLPGMQVDADGNIKAQGKDVKKVLVDGKTFFGDDPKMATKNLGAETISKVQVFNDKSEAAKISGIDDGKKEKTINLELKEEFKNGKFGKITAGIGNNDRWVGSGNFNKFNKTEQFSVIGYGNNINKTGVNWSDYGEFKGNNSFNDFDNGDFGFGGGGGGMRFYYSSNDDTPTNNFDGRGFTKNGGIGANYNFDNKKTKFSSNYFYNQTKLDLSTISKTQTFQNNNSFFSKDTSSTQDFRGNHSIGARFEKMIDSSTTLIIKGNFRLSKSQVDQNSINGFSKNENTVETQQELDNFLGKDILKLNASGIYKHKFKNKARSFSVSAGISQLNNDGSDLLNAVNKFYLAKNVNDQIRATNLINTTEINSNQLKASLLYVEPLSKKMFLETFYNVSSDNNKSFRNSKNKSDDRRLDSLSNYYNSNILYNRIGTDVRYSNEGKNFALGIAALSYKLTGNVYLDKKSILLNEIDKTYFGITPYLNSTIEFKNNMYTDLSYTYNFSAPQINDLQPIVNNNNPFFITKGNPNLSPEKSHNINFSLNKFDPASFSYINFWSSFNFYDSQVVYNQTISDNFVTTSSPINLGGGYNHNIGIYTGFPIIKTKLTFNANASINNFESPAYINNVLNKTNSKNRNIGFSLNGTPSNKFFVDANFNIGRNNIAYSIQKSQDQLIKNTSLSVSVKWNFVKKTFLETNYNYTAFENERFNFERKVPIWNASVRRLFLKDNKLEMRLAAFDLLNKNVGINQNASTNFVSTEIAPTLARYFMLSLTYNIKGHEDKLKKNGWN